MDITLTYYGQTVSRPFRFAGISIEIVSGKETKHEKLELEHDGVLDAHDDV
jgi:hypothetical protein